MSFRRELKRRVRNRHRRRYWADHDREDHTCPCCGRGYEAVGFQWEVHHRDGDALNGLDYNLVAVCRRCHKLTHRSQRTVGDVNGWRGEYDTLNEGLSGSPWRGMGKRKSAPTPDCAHGTCTREAATTITHHRYGERRVCGLHIVAAASGAQGRAIADGGGR